MHTCTQDCVDDLEQHGMLLRIKHEVDPYLEMAEIHRQVFAKQGPAILFEKVKNSPFSAVSNLFGTLKRSEFIFRHSIAHTQQIMEVWANPFNALRNPLKALHLPFTALQSVPLKVSNRRAPVLKNQCRISDLPQIHSWPQDGGAFVTLPQVCTLPPGSRSIFKSNLGMYRVQMSGNQYEQNKEAGLHYQIHRGIGIHHTQAVEKGVPLKVSIFVGGPPSATVAAMMPMPESMSELTFAGMLGGHRFRYTLHEGWVISAHADFCILGTIAPDVKPEGPFGDHLGFHSLVHDFPYIQIEKVLYRDNAIWPFTVVGRPPQEDTSFGQLVHKLTGNIIPTQVPGVQSIHAVDAAGVHSLLLAVGSERYVPYERQKTPRNTNASQCLTGLQPSESN
jgi:4-hydroxy-3-polyprenylbenzoate decarboxylase